MADWVTGEMVAAELGRPVDDRCDRAAASSCQLVRRRRGLTADEALAADPAVHEGTLKWACILYQSHNSPSGFASYEQEVGAYPEYGDSISEIYRLIGADPVIA